MFIDFSSNESPLDYTADLCIVGSGVIGLAIASCFLDQPDCKLIIVEHGGLIDTPSNSAVPPEVNTGDIASGVSDSRACGFGGSSLRWAGQALPFAAIDFQDRSFITASGWPLTRRELEPYYEKARRYMALDATPFDADIWDTQDFKRLFGDSEPLSMGFSKFSPQTNLAHVYRNRIGQAGHIHCIHNAQVVHLQMHSSGNRVNGVRIHGRHGRAGSVAAEKVILCGGGIENPRILLASNQVVKAGVGNEGDLVGRYYQDHVGYYGARLEPLNRRLFSHLFSSFLRADQKYVPKVYLSEALQSSELLLNVTGNIGIQEKEISPRQSARRLYHDFRQSRFEKRSVGDLSRLLKAAPMALKIFISHYFERRILIPHDADIFLIANAETEPLASSRITLSSEKDEAAMPKVLIHWVVTDKTRDALVTYYSALKSVLEAAGIARVHLSPVLNQPGAEWKSRAYSLYHHMGATRMAKTKEDGVVDVNCRVFSVENLYIAGCSVFPTGSSSNPTYTALALAFRLAEHLQNQPWSSRWQGC